MDDPIPVRVRECPDGSHPDGDVVYLSPTLSLDGGILALTDFREANGNPGELMRRWWRTFVSDGAIGWTIHEPGAEADPFDLDRLLRNFEWSWAVGNRADDLYSEAVMSPLGLGRAATSPPGPTSGPTSPPRASTTRPRASSSRGRTAGRRSRARTP